MLFSAAALARISVSNLAGPFTQKLVPPKEGMRDELETLAFRWLHPDAFAAVTGKLAELRAKNEGLVEDIRSALAAKLAQRSTAIDDELMVCLELQEALS